MQSLDSNFKKFKSNIDEYTLPERFTFPFYYEPHPLCVLAAEELQAELSTTQAWQHDFGLDAQHQGCTASQGSASGKMFGVLLVRNSAGELGYLSAFSGNLAETNQLPGFVPPVFDMLTDGSFFRTGQVKINQINDRVSELESNPDITLFEKELANVISASDTAIENHRFKMTEARKLRKLKRKDAVETLTPEAAAKVVEQLGQQSVIEKLQLRDLKLHWDAQIEAAQQNLNSVTDELNRLKEQRKAQSNALQTKLFEQFSFLNQAGAEKSLQVIFSATPRQVPPAGAGECAAPKLLHYAFKHGFTPLALAEFWWGASPKSEIRKHGQYYPACQGKCQPILGHMLEGMTLDENPLLTNPAAGKTLDILYQDDDMLVLNKPSGFLSVPGKNIEDSVAFRMEQMFPQAKGHLIVHRLDMATSGLMVIALTKKAHKRLQKQFIGREVEKHYEALLDGNLAQDSGVINLPLRGDYDDLPRQLVCHEHGKPAQTRWQVIERRQGKTRLHLFPLTGRTHQLRVHCAHMAGLGTPITGDDLYGLKAERLHLHAGYLALNHPISREPLVFEVEAGF